MNERNLKYIANLKVQDVPWSRLTTAYGRASEFPKIFEKLALAIEACDAARSSGGGQNLISKPGAGQNLKSKPGAGKNSTDAARCGVAQNFVNLAQKSESKFKKEDNETAKFYESKGIGFEKTLDEWLARLRKEKIDIKERE